MRGWDESRAQPEHSSTAFFLVVNQLEMVGLGLTLENSFQHGAKLLVPRSFAQLVHLPPHAFGRSKPEHSIEGFVGSAHVELRVENQQRFAGSRGARHSVR